MDQKQTRIFKSGILIWMTLQNSVHTVVLRYSRSRSVEQMFLPSVAVFWMEIVKIVICLIVVVFEEGGFKTGFRAIYGTVVLQPLDTLKVCVPSFLYTLQNNLFYLAASNLEAATFMVRICLFTSGVMLQPFPVLYGFRRITVTNTIMSQLKIITTALFAVCLLKKSLSWTQWISLFMLFAGVSLVQFQESATVSKKGIEHQSPFVGLLAIIAASTLSGFAGVYFEKILKKPVDVSVWMRNVQLAVMAAPISGVTMLIKDINFINANGLMYGFDYFVWFVVFWYGIGGLTVAVCIKYADNIAKNFATSFAIVLSTLMSVYVFNFVPNFLFVVGASVVIASIFLYSKVAQKQSGGTTPKSVIVVNAQKLDQGQKV